MTIILGSGCSPVLGRHEATALSLLLAAMETAASRSLAVKLEARASDDTLVLEARVVPTGAERRALLRAIAEFPPDRLPERVREIRDALWDV